MTFADEVGRRLDDLRRAMSRRTRGRCVSIDEVAGTATVDIGGGIQVMPIIHRPIVGVDCWVDYFGPQPYCAGHIDRSPFGEILTAPTDGQVRVRTDDGSEWVLPYALGIPIEIGVRVAIDWKRALIDAVPSGLYDPDLITRP